MAPANLIRKVLAIVDVGYSEHYILEVASFGYVQ